MRLRSANALPLGLMLLLAALTLFLQYVVQDEGNGDTGSTRHEPDAVIDNFSVNRLGQDGKPEYTLSAPKMVHFPDNDSAEVLYPRVVHLAPDGANVTATANRGVVTKDGEEGFFYGNVLIVRDAIPGHQEMRARTEFLHVINETRTARTDQPVVITEGNSTLTGVGMELQHDTGEVRLFSQVRGVFDAKK